MERIAAGFFYHLRNKNSNFKEMYSMIYYILIILLATHKKCKKK